jgi:hypothetical protein
LHSHYKHKENSSLASLTKFDNLGGGAMHPLFKEKRKTACWKSHNKWEEQVHKYGVGICTGDMAFLEQKHHQSTTEQEIHVGDVHLLTHLKDD